MPRPPWRHREISAAALGLLDGPSALGQGTVSWSNGGGRIHRNPEPLSFGSGDRFQQEPVATFVGIRSHLI